MTEAQGPSIPDAIHDVAGQWLVRMEGQAEPADEQAFRQWIEADFRHRIAYNQAMRGWRESLRLADREIGRTRKLVRAPFWMRHSTQVTAASLGVAVILGASVIGLARYGLPFTLATPAEAATFRTSLGEIRTIRLADGTQVTLDTDTLIRVNLSPAARRVTLERGRARFRVPPGERRPFCVYLPGGAVVTGKGLFDVSVFADREAVAVLEGRVELGGRTGPLPSVAGALAAGQADVLGAGSAPEPVSAAQAQWVKGMLALDATPLSDAVAMINRYNSVQVRLGDPALAKLPVTGGFQSRDPAGFARAVAASFALSIDRSDPGAIVLRPTRPDHSRHR